MSFKSLLTTSLLLGLSTQALSANHYCAGIRGNGELAPAHWGAMAKIVEHKGLPQTVAGGSSAAITLFLLDGISRNKSIHDGDNQKIKHALLLKSLVPHIEYLLNKDAKAPIIMRLIGNITGLGKGSFLSRLKKAARVAADIDDFFEVLGEYGPLLNPELVKGLKNNFSFYKGQIAESVSVFGAFDARDDMSIFYRKGLVDFKFLAVLFGRMADFYAGYGNNKVNIKLDKFVNTCAQDSVGKLWSELIKVKPECNKLFTKALDKYYEVPMVRRRGEVSDSIVRPMKKGKRKFPNKMVFEKVGSGLNALPTTAVIHGSAAKRYTDKLKEYHKKRAQGISDFNVDYATELNYGYWGNEKTLNQVNSGLNKTDLKSSKFMALNNGTWFEVLATSPAEPGLANLQRIPDSEKLNPKRIIRKRYFAKLWGIIPTLSAITWFNEKNPSKGIAPFKPELYSAGGWSDLHPTLVLKASGCDDIVYVTRQGGESVFGQQIFIRLTGYTDKISFWRDIKEGNRRGWTNLSEEERTSPWNQLYNLANPTSSYNKSIATANAVYCTDWDKFYIFKGEVEKTLQDAYSAPVFTRADADRENYDFGHDFEGKSPDNFPGCILK